MSAPQIPKRGFARTFEAVGYRDFRYLWFSQMTNSAAQWMMMVALPILVIKMTDQPEIHLGLVMTVRTLPALGLGLFAGALADMMNRKTILLTTRFVVTALAVWFAVINVGGWVALQDVYIFSVARGATMVFDQPPRRAMIPSIVPPHLVVSAMALNTGSVQLMRVLAASIAGLIIATAGLTATFVAVGLVYVVGVPFVLQLRVADHEREGYTGAGRMAQGIREGLAFAWANMTVRATLLIAAFYFIFGSSFTQVFVPLLAQGPMGLDEGGLGFMIAMMGAGGIVGTLTVAFVSPSQRRGLVLLLSLAAFGLLLTSFAGATYLPTPWVAFGMMAVVGAGQSIFLPLLSTLLLQASPAHMRGRSMALLGFDRAFVSVGAAVAGFASAAIGPQAALLSFGGICFAGAFVLFVFPALRRVN